MLGFSVITCWPCSWSGAPDRRCERAGDVDTATRARTGALGIVLLLLLLAAAVVAALWTVRVGDIGARAVWNPTWTGLFRTARARLRYACQARHWCRCDLRHIDNASVTVGTSVAAGYDAPEGSSGSGPYRLSG